MVSVKNTGRVIGLFWLLTAIAGGFGLFYIRSTILVVGNAATTATNILTLQPGFRLAIVSTLAGQIFLLFSGLHAFRLFKDTNQHVARVLLTAVTLTVGLTVMNAFSYFAAMMILSGQSLTMFTTEQLNATAYLLVRLANGTGQGLIEIFAALFYFAFGLLIVRSKYLPTVLGFFLMFMGVGFYINIVQKFLIPGFHPVMFTRLAMTGGALGVIPTMLWLLIKGARAPGADA